MGDQEGLKAEGPGGTKAEANEEIAHLKAENQKLKEEMGKQMVNKKKIMGLLDKTEENMNFARLHHEHLEEELKDAKHKIKDKDRQIKTQAEIIQRHEIELQKWRRYFLSAEEKNIETQRLAYVVSGINAHLTEENAERKRDLDR